MSEDSTTWRLQPYVAILLMTTGYCCYLKMNKTFCITLNLVVVRVSLNVILLLLNEADIVNLNCTLHLLRLHLLKKNISIDSLSGEHLWLIFIH